MFNISQIFNIPTSPRQRKYELRPKLTTKPNLIKSKKFLACRRNESIFEGILNFLPTPLQHWVLQYEKTLYTFALHEWIYNEIVSFSTSFKEKSSIGYRQNELIQQLITQARLQRSLSLPKFKKPRISLHNIFVLMTQYKVMEQIIQDLNTEELQMMIDGLSCIYFYGVEKVENIGETFSQEQILTGMGGWGTIDQLTCCIHFITTHTKFYKSYQEKKNYSLMKQIQILQMPSFIKIYDCLQQNKKIDNIVNSIPMFMEFLQIFVKHKNNSLAGCEFVINVKWLSGLGEKIMGIINYNINKILLVNNDFNENLTAEEFQMISQLENFDEQNQKEESQIVVKLVQKAMLIKQTESKICPRTLFSYAFHHLYTVNFLIKLTKKILQLAKCHYIVYKEICEKVSKFFLKLFQCCYKFEFTLPEASIQQICEIIKIMSKEDEYLFEIEERQVRGYDYLYSKEISSSKLRQFSKNLQKSQRFGCYFNYKPRPKLSSTSEMLGQEVAEDYNVILQKDQQSIFYYLLSLIYTMRIDYLPIVYNILKHGDKRCLQMLQFYFIKNELLHFLFEIQHEVQLKDKSNVKMLYNTLGMLLKGNLVSYAIIDQLIDFQTDQHTGSCQFVEDLKKNFSESKELTLILLADNITVNSKYHDSYSYCPLILKKMLYPCKQQLLRDPSISCSKHQVWISYIFNVILHELFTLKKKLQEIENKKKKIVLHKYENLVENILFVEDMSPRNQFDHEIYNWVTLILFLHIDYTQEKKHSKGMKLIYYILELDDDIILGQFVMTYLTTILSEAIKWKSKKESQKMIDFMKTLEHWENHYTDLILSQENNEDVLQKQYGGVIKFLYLKRWNRKIVKTIKLYLQSMDDYNLQQKEKKKALEKIRSLKNLLR